MGWNGGAGKGQTIVTESCRVFYNRAKQQADYNLGDRGLDSPDPNDIVLPDALQQMVLLDDYIGGKRILAFASHWALEFFANNNNQIAMDGTFEVNII